MKGISRGRASSGSLASSSAETHTAIQIEADESTPLLLDARRNRNHDAGSDSSSDAGTSSSTSSDEARKLEILDLRLIGVVFLSVTGLLVASYLLITESRMPTLRYALDLVSYNSWSNTVMTLGAPLNHSNVASVMITHTGGKGCVTSDGCVEILKEMQAKGNDHYSFLIGDDGLTYEVRGWDHESGLQLIPETTSLLIGFIGNYTMTAPSDSQLKSAMSLIRESIKRKKLQRPYKVYGMQNLTLSRMDGEALFLRIGKWKDFNTLRHVM